MVSGREEGGKKSPRPRSEGGRGQRPRGARQRPRGARQRAEIGRMRVVKMRCDAPAPRVSFFEAKRRERYLTSGRPAAARFLATLLPTPRHGSIGNQSQA